MTSDARFGIELYDEGAGGALGSPSGSLAGETSAVRIGHIWSPDAELIVRRADDTVAVVDPSGANPRFLNSSAATLDAFIEAFRVFYLGDRPAAPTTMTVEEARARLAALHRGETLPEAVAPTRATRGERLAALRASLETVDAAALAEGTWWGRILQRPEFDPGV